MKKREFVIKDNSQFGAFDFDVLANEWDDLPLAEWGVDLPEAWSKDPTDITPKNEDIPDGYGIYIECESEGHQLELLDRFEKENLKCRALIS